MTIDQQRLKSLIARPVRPAAPQELRREGSVFFVGGELPARETLETVFESHCQAPAELFCVSFASLDTFHRGEELARLLKKNFSAHLLGVFAYPPPPHLVERAYVAGVDLIDIPLVVFDEGLSRERRLGREECLAALAHARTVFPRWSTVSTLLAGEEATCSTIAGIDSLVASGVLPLVGLSPRAGHYRTEEIALLFAHLAAAWRRARAVVKPLQPLIDLSTPLAAPPKGIVSRFFERVYDAKLRASSDLRRHLRVRQVEESFESAGL